MRRSSLLALMVLGVMGFSGCAGMSRRADWPSLAPANGDEADAPRRPRFAWWARPQAEAPTTTGSTTEVAEVSKPAPLAASEKVPADIWPEPQSAWLVRHFPHLSRLRFRPNIRRNLLAGGQ